MAKKTNTKLVRSEAQIWTCVCMTWSSAFNHIMMLQRTALQLKMLSLPFARNLTQCRMAPVWNIPKSSVGWKLHLSLKSTTVSDTLWNGRMLTKEAKLCVCGHRQHFFSIFVVRKVTTRTNFFPSSSKGNEAGLLGLQTEKSPSLIYWGPPKEAIKTRHHQVGFRQ